MTHALTTTATRVSLGPGTGGLGGWGAAALVVGRPCWAKRAPYLGRVRHLGDAPWWAKRGIRTSAGPHLHYPRQMREGAAASEAVQSMSVLKVVLSVGVALIVVGLVLIPLPGPGLIVLTGGVIVAAAAAVLLRKGTERT